jgi:hypothetical protein
VDLASDDEFDVDVSVTDEGDDDGAGDDLTDVPEGPVDAQTSLQPPFAEHNNRVLSNLLHVVPRDTYASFLPGNSQRGPPVDPRSLPFPPIVDDGFGDPVVMTDGDKAAIRGFGVFFNDLRCRLHASKNIVSHSVKELGPDLVDFFAKMAFRVFTSPTAEEMESNLDELCNAFPEDQYPVSMAYFNEHIRPLFPKLCTSQIPFFTNFTGTNQGVESCQREYKYALGNNRSSSLSTVAVKAIEHDKRTYRDVCVYYILLRLL